jgi:hypothetical protein
MVFSLSQAFKSHNTTNDLLSVNFLTVTGSNHVAKATALSLNHTSKAALLNVLVRFTYSSAHSLVIACCTCGVVGGLGGGVSVLILLTTSQNCVVAAFAHLLAHHTHAKSKAISKATNQASMFLHSSGYS